MNIDHVTIAGSSLDVLRETFAAQGLATDYGGAHSNGVTHMALLGFDDGSYIELISTLQPGQPSPWWDRFITQNGGPCAWAVQVEDVAAEAGRIAALGVPVRGPHAMRRQRPDGKTIEWDLAYLGEGDPGAVLPFIINDRTPREWRVAPSASVAGSELGGIARVVIAVRDQVAAARLFQSVYGWQTVQVAIDRALGINLLSFADTPVVLAAPSSGESPLAQRLELVGDAPLAFLIESTDVEATSHRFSLSEPVIWFGRSIYWLPGEAPLPQLGIIAA